MPRAFYRIVKSDPPTAWDFLSHAERGRTPPRPDAETARQWRGLSVYETADQARRTARRFRRIGSYLARLEVPDGATVAVDGPDDDGHCNLYGDAADFLRWVAEVTPI